MRPEQKAYLNEILSNPVKVAHWLGFSKLEALNNEWIKSFILREDDQTLQSHRGSYKTTCLSIAISILMILSPNKNIIFIRKTDDDVMEIIRQVKKILENEVMQFFAEKIYPDEKFEIIRSNASEITTSLADTAKGSVQLQGLGIKASLTGKHADIIVTDDIINIKDRISEAERKYTKYVYQELQNIKNRGGRIINCGTPWHKEDAFTLMPNILKYDCYTTGLMTREEIEYQRKVMAPSLFAANYELLHIAIEGALFKTPAQFYKPKDKDDDEAKLLYDGMAHIDAAYGGDDGSALTLAKKKGDKIYVLGKLRKKHIDDCLSEYLTLKQYYRCGVIYCEDNADKGYLRKAIIEKGDIAKGYHESTNKYIKIASYLKKHWENIVFLNETDPEYINEIMDYTEDAEHEDSADSLASLIRKLDSPGSKLQFA